MFKYLILATAFCNVSGMNTKKKQIEYIDDAPIELCQDNKIIAYLTNIKVVKAKHDIYFYDIEDENYQKLGKVSTGGALQIVNFTFDESTHPKIEELIRAHEFFKAREAAQKKCTIL